MAPTIGGFVIPPSSNQQSEIHLDQENMEDNDEHVDGERSSDSIHDDCGRSDDNDGSALQ